MFFNCQQLIPCRNVANSFALILRGAARQLPFTADERVCRRQLHYLFIIYDSISSDNGGRSASGDGPASVGPFVQRALYLFDSVLIKKYYIKISRILSKYKNRLKIKGGNILLNTSC